LTAATTGVTVGGLIGVALGFYFTYSIFYGATYALINTSLTAGMGYYSGGIVALMLD